MDIIPNDINRRDLYEEVNSRTCRAGYTTRNGGKIPLKVQTSVSWGQVKLNIWPRDADGNLID